jgi:hypothetical protein
MRGITSVQQYIVCVSVYKHAMEWSLELWNYDYCIIIIITIIIIIGAHKVIKNSIGWWGGRRMSGRKSIIPFLLRKHVDIYATVRQLSTIREERKRVNPQIIIHTISWCFILPFFFFHHENGVLKKLLMLCVCVCIEFLIPHPKILSFVSAFLRLDGGISKVLSQPHT